MEQSQLKELNLLPLPQMMTVKNAEEHDQPGDEQNHRHPFN